ncbi:mannosyltransferase family protein [Streptomyces avermitilis]
MTHAFTIPAPSVEDPEGPPGGGARRTGTARRLPTTAAAALGLFAAARLGGFLVLAAVAWASGKSPLRLLGHSWDSVWYLRIAAHGYVGPQYVRPAVVRSDTAFFPLYPGLLRSVSEVTPLSLETAGLLVSWIAAATAAYGIYLIGNRLYGRAIATALVLLWGLLPHSVVLSMAYTEPVLTAFAAWSLYAVLTGRWVWAGVLAACAGLARPNGCAVAAAVLVTAAYEIWRTRGRGVSHRLWTGAALAPLGWCGYVGWVGHRQGDLLGGYFTVQRLWGSRFDLGYGSLLFVKRLLLHGGRFVFPISLLLVAVAVLLFALLLADRTPLPLLVHSGVLLLVALGGAGFFQCKPRFLLPAFPLLIPLARALVRTARARPSHAVLVVGALAGLSFAYGAYLVAFARTPL